MQAGNVRGASLAIVQGTRLVYAKGYTWADPGYPVVTPTTFFRQASVSKLITAIAVYQLIQEGKLTLDTTLESVLKLRQPAADTAAADDQQPFPGEVPGSKKPKKPKPVGKPKSTAPVDARFGKITVHDLLEHTCGLDLSLPWDDGGAATASGDTLPATPDDLAVYSTTLPLWAAPGDKAHQAYNNAGYFMLSLIVAKRRSASSFIDAIKPTLMAPLGITRIRASQALLADQPPDEALYDPDTPNSTGQSVMTPDQPQVPLGYGTENTGNFLGAGGLSAAATDIARILAALSMGDDSPILKNKIRLMMLDNAATTNDFHPVTDEYGATVKVHGCHGFDGLTKMPGGVYVGNKGGYLVTSQNAIYLETNGTSYVICWNSHTSKPSYQNNLAWYPVFQKVLDATKKHNWGSTDLFPSYGMPSLPVVKVRRIATPVLKRVEFDRSLVHPKYRKLLAR